MATIVAVAAVLGSLLVLAPAAPASAHGYGTNGCSVPGNPSWKDSPGGFDFHDACDQHDRCYVFHSAGEGRAGRKACDDMFYRLMQQAVWRSPWWEWGDGLVVAGSYYTAVRACGGQPFLDANPASRANTPMANQWWCPPYRFYFA